MKKTLLGAALLVSACTPAAQQQAQPQPATSPQTTQHTTGAATISPGTTGGSTGGATVSPAGSTGATATTGTGTTASAPLDVAVFLALDSAPADLADKARAGVAAMLAEAQKRGADTRVAVVAGAKDRGSTVLAAAKTVDFDLAPKDTLLSATVAGCAANASDFPDPHLAGSNPKVCGSELLSLAGNTPEAITHSWLWALNPVKGTLTGFFRPGTRRLYAFVANGDAQLFDAAAFEQLVSAQGGAATSTLVVAPLGSCGLDDGPATRLPGLPGDKLDICGASPAQMGAAMATALKAAAP